MLSKTKNVPKTYRRHGLAMVKKWPVRIYWCRRIPERFEIEKNLAAVMSIIDRRRCARMDFSNFSKFLIFFKLFFFIRVLIFLRSRRDHYFLQNRLMADMHLWKRHGVNTQKRWHSMLPNQSFSCRDFHFDDFDTISLRTIKNRKTRLNQM